MSAHTPGPWTVVDTHDDRRRLQIHSSKGPVIVALIPNVDERDMTGITKEAQANARLIAAAPELLGVMRSFISELDANRDRGAIQMLTVAFVMNARALLARVGGER